MRTIKEFSKIREQLGREYHLGVSWKPNEITWALYRNYDDPEIYFSKDNKAIMTSATHSYEDLEKFAKEHKKYNYINFDFPMIMGLLLLALVLSFLNAFWLCSPLVTGFVYGINITQAYNCLIYIVKKGREEEIYYKELRRYSDKALKKFQDDTKKLVKLTKDMLEK